MTDGLARVTHCDWCDEREFAEDADMIPVVENVHVCKDCAAELAFDSLQGTETMTPLRRVLQRQKNAGHRARPPREGHDAK